MFIGVSAKQIDQLLQECVVQKMAMLQEGIGGDVVDGKHIYIDSAQIRVMCSLYEGRTTIYHLCKVTGKIGLKLCTQCFVRLGQPFCTMLHKPIIIQPRHRNIDIIIPWDEPLMTYGSQHRSCHQIIPNLMLLTYLIDSNEDVKETLLEWTYVV